MWLVLTLIDSPLLPYFTHSLVPMLKNVDRPVAQAARVTRRWLTLFACLLKPPESISTSAFINIELLVSQ